MNILEVIKMISKSMARIIAKISGDGNLSKRQIMYFNKCPELIQEFKEDVKDVFGKVKMSEGFMSSGTRYVAVYGKEIVRTMLTYIPSYNSFYIKIPPAILGAKDDIVKEYVRTFYDDEGSASLRLNRKTNEWKRSITLVSNSNLILNQIRDILVKKKISTNIIIRNRPIGHRDKTYILGITGKHNFIAFREKIGFKHPRKLKMLNLMVESYNSTSKNEAKFIKLKVFV